METLFKATQGNFRKIVKVLYQASELIAMSKEAHERFTAAGKKDVPEILTFDADVIRKAPAMTEDIG